MKLVNGRIFDGERELFVGELTLQQQRELENITNSIYPELLPRRSTSRTAYLSTDRMQIAEQVPCPCPDVDIPPEVLAAGGERLTTLLAHNMNYWDASRALGLSENALRTWFHRFRKGLG